MSHHTLHPTPVSGPPCPASTKTPSNRKVSFTPVLPVYGLTRLLEAGVETKTAISTARTLTQAEQDQTTGITGNAPGTINPHPTSTIQGVTPLSVPQWGYNNPPTNPFAPSGQPFQSLAPPGFIASTPVNPSASGQQNPHWLTNQPPPTSYSGTPNPTFPTTTTSVALDDRTRMAQQEQAMQAFSSVAIYCDRQRSGRFDDWVAHLEATLDLGNFEEARKLRLMRSKLYGEAAEEFDTFKLDNPIRSQDYAAVKARLLKLFHSTETRSQRSVEFHNMKREPEENMRRYANRIRKAFHKAYPMEGVLDSATAASREQMMMDRFIEGLQHDLQPRVKHKQFNSFEALIDKAELAAMAIEENQTRVRIHAAYGSPNIPGSRNELAGVLEALEKLNLKIDQTVAAQTSEFQQSIADVKRQLPEVLRKANLFCDFHNTYGFHTTENCFTKFQQRNDTCTTCRGVGHRPNFCPTIKNPRPPPPDGNQNEAPQARAGALRPPFIVVQGIMEECVLGLDALYQHDFVIDGRERRVYRAKESDQLQDVDQPIMMAASRLKIPPSSACLMESGNSGFKLFPDTTCCFTKDSRLPPGLRPNDRSSTAHSLGRVAFRPCARVASCANKPSNLPPEILEASLPDVAEDVKNSLRNLLLANKHVFAFKTSDLGNTGLVKHVIDTQGLGPIRQRPYRASPHQKEASKKIIEELLANNIIRPSISPWAAPIVLVKKKTGDDRLFLPTATNRRRILDLLHGQQCFSTLDLASGYWQIEMEESSKEKTAFIVENNLYEWNRLAFGLTNAPGTFQRLMNFVLQEEIGKTCLVYLDDIIIFSKTTEDHIKNLNRIFELLDRANLRVKLSKCKFLAKSVIWGASEEEAFEFLRKCLTSEPILAYPDFSKEFLIYTDASDYGLGAVLSQMHDGKDKPIAYASRHLNKAEVKYSTIEKEAAAVIFGIKRFRHYLQDEPFTIVSDHRPLQWLQTFKDETGRLGRWSIILANLKYSIKYRPGRVHENADFFSRLPVQAVQNGTLSEENSTQIWAKEIDLFSISNGLLVRRNEPTSKKRRRFAQDQVVVPLSLRKPLLQEYHDSPLSGHLAYQRTILRLRDKYYWPTMLPDVKEYCLACEPCALQRRSNLRAFLNPLDITSKPFELLGLDFLGPIQPHSLQGNNHVLVITDYFTKWVEVIALPDQTALTTSQALMDKVVLYHGPPKAIVTDRGSNFTSELFSSLCRKLQIKQLRTTAYHPQTNGLTERFNKTVVEMLRKYMDQGFPKWEEMLGPVAFAYRNSVHSSTLETPYFLNHGRDPTMPIDQFLLAPSHNIITPSDYKSQIMQRLHEAFLLVKDNLALAKGTTKGAVR
ncbi:hypothetical protein GHT06_022542 [Daphnia sinensis]|uniref:RNA-directed DNA polymerase n=1 Tax=Daphnia sinensis TaxID=1820382 RepID=A0AAD5KY99_9CRUS|nr:hypothetical protein GHT06_022542 [Daphnia sinensis]